MKRLGIRHLLPFIAITAIVLFPPWAQDDPSAPMADYRGTKFSRGHAFILVRPAPAIASDYRVYAPPVTAPVEIDRAEWLREALTLLAVSWLLVVIGARSALSPQGRRAPFGAPTLAIAILSALVTPVPLIGPVAFQPIWFLTDSNHGIPGWFMMLIPWTILSCVEYLMFGVTALIIQRVALRNSANVGRAPA